MRKICLTIVGLYLGLLSAFSQNARQDSSGYRNRTLKVEEVNLVSGYYHQEGDHAAVTGGIGSQQLTNIATSIDVRLSRYDKKDRKHSLLFDVGVDHYTSASSDKIDPNTISSASMSDNRIYPSASWSVENEAKGTTLGAGLSFSSEYDYTSFGGNLSFAKKTKDRSGEFSIKAQLYLDDVSLLRPVELRNSNPVPGDEDNNGHASRNSYSASLSYSQIINQRLQVMFLLDVAYQEGYLGLPFYRVYFKDNSVHIEHLPDTRFKIPIGFRANYFMGDKLIIRGFYRYYQDDWGLKAHTFDIETPVKLTPFFSITPFYRFYTQQAVDHFAPYQVHTAADKYFTSNYDLAKFNSHFAGAGFRAAPPKGVLGIRHFNMVEIRYGHYHRSNSMNSNSVSMNLRFK
jgi:hypothetical protein